MTVTTQTPTSEENELLAAARRGDEAAFRELIAPREAELHAHCYRMLGSVDDAEDALQEVLLRAWLGLRRFEGRSSLRSWLYRIATNTCLNVIEKRRPRVLPVDYSPPHDPHAGLDEPLSESVWIDPYPDEMLGLEDRRAMPEARYEQREAVELAFIAALQLLPPSQRAVLILREVLGFSAKEVAASLGTTPASVNSALQRARRSVDDRLPEQTQQTTLRALGDQEVRAIVDRYVDAIGRDDIEGMLAMLTEDAIVSMPPIPTWYRGIDAIRASVGNCDKVLGWRHLTTTANGQPAVGGYVRRTKGGVYAAEVLTVFSLRGDRISEAISFVDPTVFERFGLPDQLSG
jgi:RNA polymerase sigma-70 factor (ECF subfamily)